MSNTGYIYSFSEVLERTTRKLMGTARSAFTEEDKQKIKCALRAYLLPSHLKLKFKTDELDDWNFNLTLEAKKFLETLLTFNQVSENVLSVDPTHTTTPKEYATEMLDLAAEYSGNFNLKFTPALKYSRAPVKLKSRQKATQHPSWDEESSFPRLIKRNARHLLGDSLYESLQDSKNYDYMQKLLVVTNAIRHSMMPLGTLSSTHAHKPLSGETLRYSEFKKTSADHSLDAYANHILLQNRAAQIRQKDELTTDTTDSVSLESHLRILLTENAETNHFDIHSGELQQIQSLIPLFENITEALQKITPHTDGTISPADRQILVTKSQGTLTQEMLTTPHAEILTSFLKELSNLKNMAAEKSQFLGNLRIYVSNILSARKDQLKPLKGINTYAEYLETADEKLKSLLGYQGYLQQVYTATCETKLQRNLTKRKVTLCEKALEKLTLLDTEENLKYKPLLLQNSNKLQKVLNAFNVEKHEDLIALKSRLSELPTFDEYLQEQRSKLSLFDKLRRRSTSQKTKFERYFQQYCTNIHLMLSAGHTNVLDSGSETASSISSDVEPSPVAKLATVVRALHAHPPGGEPEPSVAIPPVAVMAC